MAKSRLILLLAVSLGLAAAPGRAQEAAPSRCGGLLCDMGLFGGPGSEKADLPCNDFLCRAFGGSRQADAAPPPPAAAEPMPEKKTVSKVRKKSVKVAKKEPAESPSDAVEKK